MSDRVRLFVGTSCNNHDLEAQAVLEFSVRLYASLPVDITWMQMSKDGPWSGWRTETARTPFTHYRWSLPAVCGYEGRAIYTDSDFIFRADVAELWRQPIPEPAILLTKNPEGKVRTCCMLFDCARAKGHIPDLDALRRRISPQDSITSYLKTYRHLMAPFEGDWNCIDLKGYEDINDPRIKAIHYSRVECQPSLRHAKKRLEDEGKTHWYKGPTGPHWRPELIDLFDRILVLARENGYPPEKYRIEPHGDYVKKPFVYAHSKVAP
jgi:hypothetical protein